MPNREFNEKVLRPVACPSCEGKVIDTLAKVITATALWCCRVCDHTWTGAPPAVRSTR